MRIVFLGTPDFACPSLSAIHAAGHEIPLVVSQPDRPRGRRGASEPSPVRARAAELGLESCSLEKGGRKALYARVLEHEPDVVVVVAFGHIIREPLLNGPRHGCLNLHASLLPRWRGPAPIHRAIVAGDGLSGVSTMRLEAGVDTGPVYGTEALIIGGDETAGELHDRLAEMGASLLVETLAGLEAGFLHPLPQETEGITHAPLLRKEEGSVDFDASPRRVHDRIRGLSPWPGITVEWEGRRLKLSDSRVLPPSATAIDTVPGTILAVDAEGMTVACREGSILIARLQLAGRKWTEPEAFARGESLSAGQLLIPSHPVDMLNDHASPERGDV